ncbi:hypothetical protein H4R34_004100 [Dimargaris verticillata]|uniref:C2H2-type domain-containing protein n=1 Tax=Dimargaris verticillata TaxID=2761393 RepID=A0A9W8B4U7_9FUNG|nr:hypothetical protein H4R34_004100 [Dimargaris verticillata]
MYYATPYDTAPRGQQASSPLDVQLWPVHSDRSAGAFGHSDPGRYYSEYDASPLYGSAERAPSRTTKRQAPPSAGDTSRGYFRSSVPAPMALPCYDRSEPSAWASESMAMSATTRTDREYQCDSCRRTYSSPAELTAHRWEHTDVWPQVESLEPTKHKQVQMLEAAQILMGMLGVDITTAAPPCSTADATTPTTVADTASQSLQAKSSFKVTAGYSIDARQRADTQSFPPSSLPSTASQSAKVASHVFPPPSPLGPTQPDLGRTHARSDRKPMGNPYPSPPTPSDAIPTSPQALSMAFSSPRLPHYYSAAESRSPTAFHQPHAVPTTKHSLIPSPGYPPGPSYSYPTPPYHNSSLPAAAGLTDEAYRLYPQDRWSYHPAPDGTSYDGYGYPPQGHPRSH